MSAARRKPEPEPLAVEVARLREAFEAARAQQARAIIELTEDMRELQARLPADTGPPADLVALKTAAGLVGFDRETVRRWAMAGEVASIRRGAAWWIDLPSLRRRAGR